MAVIEEVDAAPAAAREPALEDTRSTPHMDDERFDAMLLGVAQQQEGGIDGLLGACVWREGARAARRVAACGIDPRGVGRGADAARGHAPRRAHTSHTPALPKNGRAARSRGGPGDVLASAAAAEVWRRHASAWSYTHPHPHPLPLAWPPPVS